MKIIIFITIFITGIILLIGAFNLSQAKTESQKYETLYKKGNFEIRFYPQAIMATVNMPGTYDDSKNSGFRALAGYIFGKNNKEMKIAMTSPVRVTHDRDINTMSFVLPSAMQMEELPEPANRNIILHKSEPVYVAAIRYGGYTGNEEIENKKIELVHFLDDMGISYTNNFEYLGYNPPYQFVNRRNEVLVELKDFNPSRFSE